MQQIAIKEAETRLADLLQLVSQGEDVIITKDDGTAYRIITINKPYPKFGSAKGLIHMADDFDEPVEDFEEYMP